MNEDRLEKMVTAMDKIAGEYAKVDTLAKMVRDQIVPELQGLRAGIAAIAAMPAPTHLYGRAISKAEDNGGTGDEPVSPDELTKALSSMSDQDRASLLIKVAQMRPGRAG